MAHGEKDYTTTTIVKVLAAKVDFDLPLILVDRFDSANFLWATAGAPADFDAGMEAGAAYEGDAGLALRTSLAAAGAGETAGVSRYGFTTTTRKLSFSALFRLNQTNAFVRELRFRIWGEYNLASYIAAFRYRAVDLAWDYLNVTGGWTEFLTPIRQDDGSWNRIYFELDLENMQYIVYETADRRISLTGTQILSAPALVPERLIMTIHIENEQVGTRADVSIDDIIIKELGS